MNKQHKALELHREALRNLRSTVTELTKHVTNAKKAEIQEALYNALVSFDRFRETQILKPGIAPRFTELETGKTGKPLLYRDQS